MRSTCAPKGQQAPSPGQVSEANGTLGYAQGFPMRPRRGQKQRQMRSCHGFCPLRGRFVCAPTKPRVSLAALTCPGLEARCPFGARVERLWTCHHTMLDTCENFCPRVERLWPCHHTMLDTCENFCPHVERWWPMGKPPRGFHFKQTPLPKTNPGFEFSVGGTGFSKPGFEISIGGVVRPGGGSRGERFTFRGKQTARASWHRALRAGPHTA